MAAAPYRAAKNTSGSRSPCFTGSMKWFMPPTMAMGSITQAATQLPSTVTMTSSSAVA